MMLVSMPIGVDRGVWAKSLEQLGAYANTLSYLGYRYKNDDYCERVRAPLWRR